MNYKIDHFTIARPYAKAAFEYALAQKQLSAWSAMLFLAGHICSDEAVIQQLAIPEVTAQQRSELIHHIGDEYFDEAFKQFVATLAQSKRLNVLPEVQYLFEQYRSEHDKTITAEVCSAQPLTDSQRERITQALSKRLQRQVSLDCQVDKNLLGGLTVKAGDWVLDASVRRQLQQMKQEMMA